MNSVFLIVLNLISIPYCHAVKPLFDLKIKLDLQFNGELYLNGKLKLLIDKTETTQSTLLTKITTVTSALDSTSYAQPTNELTTEPISEPSQEFTLKPTRTTNPAHETDSEPNTVVINPTTDELLNDRDFNDDSTTFLVVIGSITGAIAVSGAIVSLVVYFKAAPISVASA